MTGDLMTAHVCRAVAVVAVAAGVLLGTTDQWLYASLVLLLVPSLLLVGGRAHRADIKRKTGRA